MVPPLVARSLLAGLAGFLLTADGSAQTRRTAQPAVAPQFAGVYRVASGTLDTTAQLRALDQVIFNNARPAMYYATPGAHQEWIDEGTLVARNASRVEQINSFDFSYCSSTPDAQGNAVELALTIYDKHLACSGPTFQGASCLYDLVDLPGGDASGNLQCWTVTVDLEEVECSASPTDLFRSTSAFAWGIRPTDDTTGPMLGTGGHGTQDSVTWYEASAATGRPLDATDPFLGCFWFGGGPNQFASFALRLCGPDADEIVLRSSNGAHDLDANVDVNAGQSSTWSLVNPQPSQNYWLVASLAPADAAASSGAGLCIDLSAGSVLAPTPLPFPGNFLSVPTPVSLPVGTFAQVLGVTTPSVAGIRSSSVGWLLN